jgi:outer membrane lipoprotein SlyB
MMKTQMIVAGLGLASCVKELTLKDSAYQKNLAEEMRKERIEGVQQLSAATVSSCIGVKN